MGERLNFLLTEGEHGWWARCLEHDFVTQADTLNDLYYEIRRTVVGHIVISQQSGHAPFAGLGPAAPEFWSQFRASALRIQPREDHIQIRISEPIVRPTPEVHELRVAGVA
jgi:hypothetical protein